MGTNISKIEKEFILSFLIKNKIKFEIKKDEISTLAYVIDQNNKEIKIEFLSVPEEFQKENTEIRVFFYFQNNYHTFNSKILKLKQNIAIIDNAVNIVKNLNRKYQRTTIKNLNVEFKLQGDLLPLDYPESKVYYYPEKAPVNADFSNVNIADIIQKFKQKMSTYVSVNHIKMFRNKKITTLDEQLIQEYGKILLIPNTHSDFPSNQISPDIRIITKKEWQTYEVQNNETKDFLLNKALSNYLSSKADLDIYSQCIIPILYRNYIIGIIILLNKHKNSNSINLKVINYAYKFSRLLSYALKESGYFVQENANKTDFNLPIHDISPGGLAFYNEDNFFEDKLLLDHNAKFLIEIDKRPIRILAKLVRKFRNTKGYGYGFMFLDLKKEDFDFLNLYLNNNNAK